MRESTKCNHYVNEIGNGNGVGKYLIFSNAKFLVEMLAPLCRRRERRKDTSTIT